MTNTVTEQIKLINVNIRCIRKVSIIARIIWQQSSVFLKMLIVKLSLVVPTSPLKGCFSSHKF
jgi:hypothetical protein